MTTASTSAGRRETTTATENTLSEAAGQAFHSKSSSRATRVTAGIAFAVSALVLVAAVIASVAVGSRDVTLEDFANAISGNTDTIGAAAILQRLPRTVLGILVGAALAVAGLGLQAVTRNPLADPGILGVTSGAALAVVITITVVGVRSPVATTVASVIGAAAAAALLFMLSAVGGKNSSTLAIDGQIAAVITEAAACNMGVVPPLPGFTAALTALAHRHGAVVISDEVLTGFRSGPSGYWGVQRDLGEVPIAPDLVTFGKVVGGGLPLAAVGGRTELMDLLAPAGPVYQGGTLSGNPVAVAAGLATMRSADAAVYGRLLRASEQVSGLVAEALSADGVPHRIQRAGTLFSVFFSDAPVVDYDGATQQSTDQYRAFFNAMLEGGVSLPPSPYEAWFVTAAHDERALDRIAQVLPAAAQAAAEASRN